MKKNIGSLDRILRIVLGALLIGAGFYYENWWGAVGLIPLLTGLISWCPLYSLFGWSTSGQPAVKSPEPEF